MTREQMIDEAVRRTMHGRIDDATPPSEYGGNYFAPDGMGYLRYWRDNEVCAEFRRIENANV